MWQGGGVLFLALKMSQNSIDDVLVFDARDNSDRSTAATTARMPRPSNGNAGTEFAGSVPDFLLFIAGSVNLSHVFAGNVQRNL